MAYTATKYVIPREHFYPRGRDNTQRMVWSWGVLAENDTATEYSVGGIGSSSFEITAFSAVGLVTYSNLKGLPLVNGQRVVVYNTASNTNDGTYIVSQIVATTTTSGTFVAVAIPSVSSISGSSQTGQTAEGVGQIQWGVGTPQTQTFTATAVTVSGTQMTVTYTTLVGPQLQPTENVVLTGMTNSGNNGTFSINSISYTSSTAGSFIVTNSSAVASDSGTGTGSFIFGINDPAAGGMPVNVVVSSYQKGWVYVWDRVNLTIRIFVTGTTSNTVLNEAALGANVAFDGTMVYAANFDRSVSNQFD